MNITLRPWQITDLDSLVKYANNPNVAKNLTDAFPSPYTPEDGERYINMVSADIPTKCFAILVDDEVVGSIGVFPQSDIHKLNAELGYFIAEPYWGKGIMAEAVRQMVEYAFKTFEINRVFARPFGRNIASQKVLEKTGFQLEGRFDKVLLKNGALEDELIYALRK